MPTTEPFLAGRKYSAVICPLPDRSLPSHPMDELDPVAVRVAIEGVHHLPRDAGDGARVERRLGSVARRVQPRADFRDILDGEADMIEDAVRVRAGVLGLQAPVGYPAASRRPALRPSRSAGGSAGRSARGSSASAVSKSFTLMQTCRFSASTRAANPSATLPSSS